ncbi:MAG: hypothetical protein Q9217_002649 [Psora testacea]
MADSISAGLPNDPGWTSCAAKYSTVETMTIPLCEQFVDIVHDISPLDTPGARAFDNGCGQGALTSVLKERFPHLSVMATDAAPGMISMFNSRGKSLGWSNVHAEVLDARNLESIANDTFTHTMSTFMIALAPDPHLIAKEMHRVTKPGGIVGLATFGDPYFRFCNDAWTRACIQLDPSYQQVQVFDPSWSLSQNVTENLLEAGFTDVKVRMTHKEWPVDLNDQFVEYVFNGGNPVMCTLLRSWEKRGGRVEDVRPCFTQVIKDEWGVGDGRKQGTFEALMATGKKAAV